MANDFELENERLQVVLKRIFRRMEGAEEKNVLLKQKLEEAEAKNLKQTKEIDKLRTENDALRSIGIESIGIAPKGPEAIGGTQHFSAVETRQHQLDQLQAGVSTLRIESRKSSCVKCKRSHPEEAKACTLWEAVKANDVQSTRAYLTVCNEDCLASRKGGHTLLEWSAEEGFVEIAELLLIAGAKHNAAKQIGAIHFACRYGRTEVVQLLVNHGVDINIVGEHGQTPLHYASWNGRENTVRFLLKNKADAMRLDKWHFTALGEAKKLNQHGVVRVFGIHGIY